MDFISRYASSVVAPHFFYYPTTPHGARFLPDSKAFLYYFTSPEKLHIAREPRLRVVSSDDSTSFESGSDLLKPNGRCHFTSSQNIVFHCMKKRGKIYMFLTTWIHFPSCNSKISPNSTSLVYVKSSTSVHLRGISPSLQSKTWR